MEENKNQMIFLIIIGIATLLVAIVGATFAWFSIKLSNNEEKEEIIITKATLGSVVFESGSTIDTATLFKAGKINKKFKISQTDRSSTELIKYNIKLNVTSNTINTVEQPELILHTLTSSGNSNGGTLVNLESTSAPITSIIIGSGVIDGYETHEYEYAVSLNNANPLLLQGKQFEAYLTVELLENETKEKSE